MVRGKEAGETPFGRSSAVLRGGFIEGRAEEEDGDGGGGVDVEVEEKEGLRRCNGLGARRGEERLTCVEEVIRE